MPSSRSSSPTSSIDGRPSGEPNTSRITAVAPQPMARLPATLTGSPWPPTAVASATKTMKVSISRCTPRARYGSAAVATAMNKAIRSTGKLSR